MEAMQLSLDSPRVEEQVHISDLWLKRSGSCRLSIQLNGEDPDEKYRGEVAKILTSVSRHATRWDSAAECLKLQVSSCQLRELGDSNMPLLRHLDLQLHEDSLVAPSSRYLEFFIVHALRSLQIPEPFLDNDPIRSLAEFVSQSGRTLQEVRVTDLRLGSRNLNREAWHSVHRFHFHEDCNPIFHKGDSAIPSSDQAGEC
ncbi:hypothetical protein K438DRAFT_1755106 [Mycena galopus ATCC 62051]|nr:hypothetical protein K438DRAFT_1755106 [Mycena galopus ATCC 62051]